MSAREGRRSEAAPNPETQQPQDSAHPRRSAERAIDRVIAAFEDKGLRVERKGGDAATCQAPGHSNADRSVSLTQVGGKVLLYPHAGEQKADVLAAVGLTMGDLFDEPGGAVYKYPNGRIVRRRYDKAGGKRITQENTDAPVAMFRLEKVASAAAKGERIWVAEGEEDVRALLSLGAHATTNPQGAGNWALVDWAPLVGAEEVVVVLDNDDAGRKRGRTFAPHLQGLGLRVRVVLPADGLGDAEDHVAAGHGLGEFVDVTAEFAPPPESGDVLLAAVRAWLARYVRTMHESDLDLLTLWAAHTHAVEALYTTPRLQLDSPVPESGKTTVLEHLQRLCRVPVQMASISSVALLVRILEDGPRTLLIDEADRTLNPKKDTTDEFIAIVNSGYKVGATRPVLVPGGEGAWDVAEMSTFAPVAIAGNSPLLPDDMRTRILRVLLLPDKEGRVEESDWERLDEAACELGGRLARWAAAHEGALRNAPRDLPEGVVGRARERWLPLKRVAVVAGGRWAAAVDAMASADVAEWAADAEAGLLGEKAAMALLRHLSEVWTEGAEFIPTADLLVKLIHHDPEQWGPESPFGRSLTPQRLGRMLSTSFRVKSGKDAEDRRGYYRAAFVAPWRTFGLLNGGHDGSLERKSQTVQTVPTVSTVPTETPEASTSSAKRGRRGGLSGTLTTLPLSEPSKPSEPSEPSEPSGSIDAPPERVALVEELRRRRSGGAS